MVVDEAGTVGTLQPHKISCVRATRHFDKRTTCLSMSRHRDDVTLRYSGDNFKDFKELQDLCGRERPKHLITDFAMPRGFECQHTAWASEKARTQILVYYTRNAEIDGKKYAVLEDFDTKKQHLVLFKEEYGRLKMFRAMLRRHHSAVCPAKKSH